MMKYWFVFVFIFSISTTIRSQQIPEPGDELTDISEEEELKNWAEEYSPLLEKYLKQPLNINSAGPDELKEFGFFNDLQINNLLKHRHLLGPLVNLYELQAVPAWDISTIKKLVPYITIKEQTSMKQELVKRFNKGTSQLLFRVSQALEKNEAYQQNGTGIKYSGGPAGILFRYKFSFKNKLQAGVTGDKDPGEKFFKGKPIRGFDFYSFHFYIKELGKIHSLAVGDYTVNMGQGLIQWQGFSFRKSAEVTSIKRQSPVIKPYHSSGEFYFFRGLALSFKTKKSVATVFLSLKKIDANLSGDSNHFSISSFLSSGLHRTESENSSRGNVTQLAMGGNLRYVGKNWNVGFNVIRFHFSKPLLKRNEPYNFYTAKGNDFINGSLDYGFTRKNFHFFGELAASKTLEKAFLNGVVIAVDRKIDLSILHRYIGKGYNTVNGNAFTENTFPVNENGLYAGIRIRPASAWRVDAYFDIYKFPWLKFLADAPATGKEFLIQVGYFPSKKIDIIARVRKQVDQINQTTGSSATPMLVKSPRINYRIHLNYKLSQDFIFRNRTEIVFTNKKTDQAESGYLNLTDIIYKPLLKRYSTLARIQYFETSGYDSRIYAYENDVSYSYTVPAFSGKGFHYYFLFEYDILKNLTLWFKFSQTRFYKGRPVNQDIILTNTLHNTQLKMQLRLTF